MKKAAEKLENNLLFREINKIGGKSLSDKWRILGISDKNPQNSISQTELKAEYKKRKEKMNLLPSDVDADSAIKSDLKITKYFFKNCRIGRSL